MSSVHNTFGPRTLLLTLPVTSSAWHFVNASLGPPRFNPTLKLRMVVPACRGPVVASLLLQGEPAPRAPHLIALDSVTARRRLVSSTPPMEREPCGSQDAFRFTL